MTTKIRRNILQARRKRFYAIRRLVKTTRAAAKAIGWYGVEVVRATIAFERLMAALPQKKG